MNSKRSGRCARASAGANVAIKSIIRTVWVVLVLEGGRRLVELPGVAQIPEWLTLGFFPELLPAQRRWTAPCSFPREPTAAACNQKMVVDLTCEASRGCSCLSYEPDASTANRSTATGADEVGIQGLGVQAEKLEAAATEVEPRRGDKKPLDTSGRAWLREEKWCARQTVKGPCARGNGCSDVQECEESSTRGYAAEATATAGRDTVDAHVYCGSVTGSRGGTDGEAPAPSQPHIPEGTPSSRIPKQPTDHGLFEL